MILLDGRRLAEKILSKLKTEIAHEEKALMLTVIMVGAHAAMDSFVRQKERAAKNVGVFLEKICFPPSLSSFELEHCVQDFSRHTARTGILVQLPLPDHIEKQRILDHIPLKKDPDVLSANSLGWFAAGNHLIMPPVVAAVKEFFQEYGIACSGKKIVIMGQGILVGKPIMLWLANELVSFTVLEKDTKDPRPYLAEADIIISGMGSPEYITGDMVKEGVIIIDAGTSESKGKIAGDVHFDSVAKKASYITPVPGGVGPLAVAMLFKNLFILAEAE